MRPCAHCQRGPSIHRRICRTRCPAIRHQLRLCRCPETFPSQRSCTSSNSNSKCYSNRLAAHLRSLDAVCPVACQPVLVAQRWDLQPLLPLRPPPVTQLSSLVLSPAAGDARPVAASLLTDPRAPLSSRQWCMSTCVRQLPNDQRHTAQLKVHDRIAVGEHVRLHRLVVAVEATESARHPQVGAAAATAAQPSVHVWLQPLLRVLHLQAVLPIKVQTNWPCPCRLSVSLRRTV